MSSWSLLSLSSCAIAALLIRDFELKLLRAQTAARTFTRMLEHARSGQVLEDEDACYLACTVKWRGIPWDQITSNATASQT